MADVPPKTAGAMGRALRDSAERLWRLPGLMLLSAADRRLAQEDPERFVGAWWGLMGASLVWGLMLCGVWGLAWWAFRDYGLLVRPAMAATAAMSLGPYRHALSSAARMLGGPNATGRAIAAAVLVLALMVCLVGLEPDFYRYECRLAWWLAWVRPWAKLYRVLLLMPLWGGWSMLVTVQFCRCGQGTEPAVAAFARGCGPVATTACMGLLLAATIQYFNYLPWTQLSISGAAILSAAAGGVALCRLAGGLRRRALLAGNLLTQIVFVLAFLANR